MIVSYDLSMETASLIAVLPEGCCGMRLSFACVGCGCRTVFWFSFVLCADVC